MGVMFITTYFAQQTPPLGQSALLLHVSSA